MRPIRDTDAVRTPGTVCCQLCGHPDTALCPTCQHREAVLGTAGMAHGAHHGTTPTIISRAA